MKILLYLSLFLLIQDNLITDKSVDGVNIGKEINKFISEVKSKYSVKKEKFMLEGDSYDIYNVYENGNKIYSVEPAENKAIIYRIWIYSSKFKTKEGIGVGSTLGDLKSKYHIKFITTEGEGGIAVSVKECDVCFILDNSKLPQNWWDKMDTKILPDNITIAEIIIA